jgi:hypothetical protein
MIRALLAAATMAVVLAFGAAAFAVWITLPPAKGPTNGVAGASSPPPRPTRSPALRDSPPPPTTPAPLLPAYAANGAPVSAEEVIVYAGSGPALLNLATGSVLQVGTQTTQSSNQLFALPDGSFVCACTQTITSAGPSGGPNQTTAAVQLQWFAASGTLERSVTLPSYVGRADPDIAGEPDHAAVNASVGPGATSLDLAWTVEAPPIWRSGIDVIELASGRIVQTLALPDVSDRAGTPSAGVSPATVTFSPDGHLALIERLGWSGPNGSATTSWHATAPVASGRLGTPVPLSAGPSSLDGDPTCSAMARPAAFATATSAYAVCFGGAGPVLRRVDLSGHPLGDTQLNTTAGGGAALGFAVDPVRQLLYAWDPFGRVLLRIDLTSGKVTGQLVVPTQAMSSDPLSDAARAFARWLAPVATAKVDLMPSLVLAADGSRLFALGTSATDPLTPSGGSTGVWVIDPSTMTVTAHWAPAADFVSLALNRDGSLLLAAGMPGADAAGTPSSQPASVTMYDSATGSIRAVAGQVSSSSDGWVMFPAAP